MSARELQCPTCDKWWTKDDAKNSNCPTCGGRLYLGPDHSTPPTHEQTEDAIKMAKYIEMKRRRENEHLTDDPDGKLEDRK